MGRVPSYTAEDVRACLAPKYDTYFAKLATGQAPTWKCDQRTKDLCCLSQWLFDELEMLACSEEDRQRQLWFWNRKSRA